MMNGSLSFIRLSFRNYMKWLLRSNNSNSNMIWTTIVWWSMLRSILVKWGHKNIGNRWSICTGIEGTGYWKKMCCYCFSMTLWMKSLLFGSSWCWWMDLYQCRWDIMWRCWQWVAMMTSFRSSIWRSSIWIMEEMLVGSLKMEFLIKSRNWSRLIRSWTISHGY